MLNKEEITQRLELEYDPQTHRRIIAGKSVIIHCHHYNARLQNILESTKQINGKEIISSSAELVFSQQLSNLFQDSDSIEDKWQLASSLYSHLGYGTLDFSKISEGIISSPHSHFVKGWNTGFKKNDEMICTFTEGYIQGVIYAITGDVVFVKETSCMNSGSSLCQFTVDNTRSTKFTTYTKNEIQTPTAMDEEFVTSENIDEDKIIQALVAMPIYGNDEGLIPSFGVYLANTPADLYNLITIRFIEEMEKTNLLTTAKRLLLFAGEICALNTFRGIMNSAEWKALIAPMVKEERDNLFGIIAVSNALGWGNWHIKEYEEDESLVLTTNNGYEATGYIEYMGTTTDPKCFMLTGVAAGLMELIHGEGTAEERLGMFYSDETQCICNEGTSCVFSVEAV